MSEDKLIRVLKSLPLFAKNLLNRKKTLIGLDCSHPKGHMSINDMANKRYLFYCKQCCHQFFLDYNEFDSAVRGWLDEERHRVLKFKFKG